MAAPFQRVPCPAPLEQIRDRKREKMLEAIAEDAPARLGLFERVYRGTASPRQAMKAKCLECVGFDTKAIVECTAAECPLYDFRPYLAGAE